ncbi:hypothetical protein HMPREF1494_1316 [Bifidobacterium sp. MSTE12]|nr:hypothetical protein HMPREF1494_1316 [Bifidobacterium sp. MSTE12]
MVVMSVPNIRICDSYVIAIAWHTYITGLGYTAKLQRWGNKWRVITID